MDKNTLENLEKLRKTDLHDPEWLSREEQKLRAHIKNSPLPPSRRGGSNVPPVLPPLPLAVIIAALAACAILAGVYFSRPTNTSLSPEPSPSMQLKTPEPTPFGTVTPTPEESVAPSPSETPLPSSSPSPDATSHSTPTPVVSATPSLIPHSGN